EHYKYVMGERSVLVSDGDDHRRKRRLLLPALNRQLVERHGVAVRALTRQAVAAWPVGQAFAPRPSLHALSLRIMLRIVFGTSGEEFGQEVARLFTSEVYQDLGTWSPWTRFNR